MHLMKIGKFQLNGYGQDAAAATRIASGAWIEILLLAGLAATLNTVSYFYSNWPVLSALPLAFVSLRHGSAAAVLSALIWVLMSSLVQKILGNTPEPLAMAHLGPILVALLCGYFSDYWREKHIATVSARQHDAQLLDEISQSHHLLQLSHARLEQRVVGGVDTLRESLQRLHTSLLAHTEQELPLADRGPELLLQFDSLTWIQSASLHLVSNDGTQQQSTVVIEATAEIGEPPSLQVNDPLVSEAIAQRKMLAVTDVRASLNAKSPLAVAPIVDNNNHVRAIVCVHKVPFLSFNRENLALMAVLAAHIGHMISTTESVASADSKQIFKHNIKRACDDASSFGLPSTLVQWTFHSSQVATTAATFIRDNVRGLDHPLLENHNNTQRLTLLCSLTDRSEFDLLHERLQQLLATRYAIDLNTNVNGFKVHVVKAKDQPEQLLAMMDLTDDG